MLEFRRVLKEATVEESCIHEEGHSTLLWQRVKMSCSKVDWDIFSIITYEHYSTP